MRLIVSHILLLGVLFITGCLPSEQAPAKADLRATDTTSKVPAIVNAVDTDDHAQLTELVHALADDDAAVRLFAIQSLQERTGQTFEYRYYESADKRQSAIDRWHHWLDEQAGTRLALPTNEPTTD